MLRELIVNGQKMADATYTADVAMTRGMAVLKSSSEAILPTAATGVDVFFVDKQSIPTGIQTLQGEISEYSDTFEKISANDYVLLKKYYAGEEIATDQVTGTPAAGTYLVAGTDGKLVAAATGVVTYMKSGGVYTDCGSHGMYVVDFIEAHTTV